MWKYTKGKHILILSIVIAFLIPAVVTYLYGYDGVVIFTPQWVVITFTIDEAIQINYQLYGEYSNTYICTSNFRAQKYILWFDEMYKNMYIPSHTNASSYLSGLAAGLIYFNLKNKKIELSNYKWFVTLWYLVVPIGICVLLSASIFYAYEFKKPAIWISVYTFVHRNSWGVISGIFLIGMALKVDSEWKGFHLLQSLNYN